MCFSYESLGCRIPRVDSTLSARLFHVHRTETNSTFNWSRTTQRIITIKSECKILIHSGAGVCAPRVTSLPRFCISRNAWGGFTHAFPQRQHRAVSHSTCCLRDVIAAPIAFSHTLKRFARCTHDSLDATPNSYIQPRCFNYFARFMDFEMLWTHLAGGVSLPMWASRHRPGESCRFVYSSRLLPFGSLNWCNPWWFTDLYPFQWTKTWILLVIEAQNCHFSSAFRLGFELWINYNRGMSCWVSEFMFSIFFDDFTEARMKSSMHTHEATLTWTFCTNLRTLWREIMIFWG